jgi:hypothetical protein
VHSILTDIYDSPAGVEGLGIVTEEAFIKKITLKTGLHKSPFLFYGNLGYVTVIWYIFSCIGMLYQEKSGNPAPRGHLFTKSGG